MKLEFSRQMFEKHSNVKFHENPSVGAELLHEDGWTWSWQWRIAILRTRLNRYGDSLSWFSKGAPCLAPAPWQSVCGQHHSQFRQQWAVSLVAQHFLHRHSPSGRRFVDACKNNTFCPCREQKPGLPASCIVATYSPGQRPYSMVFEVLTLVRAARTHARTLVCVSD
jgi:hypothetical protein